MDYLSGATAQSRTVSLGSPNNIQGFQAITYPYFMLDVERFAR